MMTLQHPRPSMTTTTLDGSGEHLDLADMRRRIKAIFIG
jgi:hypothetical protein